MSRARNLFAGWNYPAAGLGIVVIILVAAAFFLPWYHYSMTNFNNDMTDSTDYFLTKYVWRHGSAEEGSGGYSSPGSEKLAELMSQESMLLIVGLAFSAMSVLLSRGGWSRWGAIVGAIAAIILFALMANFFWRINGAIGASWSSFSGEQASKSFSRSWGPMIGWLLPLVGCVTQSAQVVILAFSNEGKR
jgi:hypothetical protein